MKLNEREKTVLVKFLKEQYETSEKMLKSGDFQWIENEEQYQKVVEHNQRIKEKYEALEEQQGEVEIDTNGVDFNDKWSWALIAIIFAFGGGFNGNNNSNE